MAEYRVAMISTDIGTSVRGKSYHKQITVSGSENFFDRIIDAGWKRSSARPITHLDIYAHCVGNLTTVGYLVNAIDMIYAYGYSDGHPTGEAYETYGVKIGADMITSLTVKKFENYAPMFAANAEISFRACSVAKRSSDFVGKKGTYSGDGIKLCQAIAAASGAYVRASASPQYYEETVSGLLFSDWTPPVFQFSPSGGYWPE